MWSEFMTQIKPYQCHICLKHLTRRSRLRMHLRAHEEELAPRLVLVCSVCDRAFKDQVDAQEHGMTSKECIEIHAEELKEEQDDGPKLQLSPTSGVMKLQQKNNDAGYTNVVPVRNHTESTFYRKTLKRMYEPADTAQAEELLRTVADEARPLIRVVEIEKAFRCEYCEDIFYVEDALNSHRRIHKGVKNPFTCHICKVSFPTYSRCTTHKTTHGFYKRSLAEVKKQEETGTNDVGAAHAPDAGARRESGGPSAAGIVGYGGFPVAKHFLCEDCGRSYLHWTYLQVHRRMKHANENYLYKCTQCDITFPNSWSMAYHKKKIHTKIPQENSVGSIDVLNRDSGSRAPCRDCGEIFTNKSALYKHRKDKHCDLPSRLSSKEGIFSCADCGKRYASKPGLEAHLRLHRAPAAADEPAPPGGGQCACAKCGDVFRSTSALLRHVKESHSHELQLWCVWCGERFAARAEMTAHARTHATHQAHACAVCGRGIAGRHTPAWDDEGSTTTHPVFPSGMRGTPAEDRKSVRRSTGSHFMRRDNS
ncbi:Zinc finger protein 836 [Eumeta japonica]|uniref:Zinc finger protein 836 n=1 Tax=Eumeta variegata TaxID=151549 RepID=A0A4C1XWY0_EUMVA|nr:Zinc finger protein 836 [Eumeta japonica]